MKKLACITFFLLSLAATGYAQQAEPAMQEDVYIYANTDPKPEYPGGVGVFFDDFKKEFKKPAAVKNEVKVYLSFIIEKDGTLSAITSLKKVDPLVLDEIKKVLSKTKKWSPGFKNGKAVRTNYILPITIK